MSKYFIHQFFNDHQIEPNLTEERSVVLLGPRDMEKWIAAVELRGEAKKYLNSRDRELIAEYIEGLIEIKKNEMQKNNIIIQPVIGLIKPRRG